jgi:ankyrin repeat protein
MFNWFKKKKSLKDQVLSLLRIAEILGLNQRNLDNSKEYLEYNEYGLCFDILITQMHEYNIEIDNEVYLLISDIAAKMRLPAEEYSFMQELVRDNPQKTAAVIKFLFHQQVLSGEIENVKAVLTPDTDLNELDELGNSPLHWAVMRGDLDIVELLLSKGANPNVLCSDGYTPKWSAADFGLNEIEELLTSFGGKIATNENFDKVSWSVFKGFLNEPMPGEE